MQITVFGKHKTLGESNDIFESVNMMVKKAVYLEECKENKELLILRGHLAVEYFLNKIIEKFLPSGNKLVDKNNFSFSKKILIIEGFNIIERDTLKFIKELNKLRNKCAHKISYRVEDADVDVLGKTLPKKIFDNIKRPDTKETLLNLLTSVLVDVAYSVKLIENKNK